MKRIKTGLLMSLLIQGVFLVTAVSVARTARGKQFAAPSQVSWMGPHPKLPPPDPASSVARPPTVLGWPAGLKPRAPHGFSVNLYASDLRNPRALYVLPNGDVLVAEATDGGNSANRIELFRGLSADGTPKLRTVFLKGLDHPFGMLFLNGWFYVANTDSLWRFPYKPGETRVAAKGKKVLDLTPVNHGHWTRELVASPDGSRIFIGVGSASNIADDGMAIEKDRANVLEVHPDGTGKRVFASGIRNPVGLAFYPLSNTLWTVVNERDGLGDDLPPDYLTHIEKGGFYGWPYSYWGRHFDARVDLPRPPQASHALTPDFALGNHVAPLGLDFYEGRMFPPKYVGGAFIGEHGSWNSSIMRGYEVYFVPFKNGKPIGQGEQFLTGFIADLGQHEVYGRPVDVKTLSDGSLLVSDDSGGKLWRVRYTGE